MSLRRIEAGLLDAGSDFDETTTPFDAGLGGLVDFEEPVFIGGVALLAADRECRTWGLRVGESMDAPPTCTTPMLTLSHRCDRDQGQTTSGFQFSNIPAGFGFHTQA